MYDGGVALERVKARKHPKPFASFGSFQQRHGDVSDINPAQIAKITPGISLEAPAKLGNHSNVTSKNVYQTTDSNNSKAHPALNEKHSKPIDIILENCQKDEEDSSHQKRLSKTKSRSKMVFLEEVWERRRSMHFSNEISDDFDEHKVRAVGRSASDCGERRSLLHSNSCRTPLSRTTSLTDDDLDELRGCIDLGFAFHNDEADRELWSTLPALKLCYAISQQLKGVESPMAPSPVSPLDDDMLEGLTIDGSPSSSPMPSLRISSPGDHPQQVKARLKHWAQAVAFTVRQNL